MPHVTVISNSWRLHGDVLVPTRHHLSDHCRRVAALRSTEREIRFRCTPQQPSSTSTTSPLSLTVPIHFSRIQIHGGALLHLVTPHLSNTTEYAVSVSINETAQNFRPIAHFLYRSQIRLSEYPLPHAARIAVAASRWACHDLCVAIMTHIVIADRLQEPHHFAACTDLISLPETPTPFTTYFFLTAPPFVERMHFPDAVHLLLSAFRTGRLNQTNEIFMHFLDSNMLQQPHHVILLLPLFRHMSIPPFFKHYLALRLGRLSDHLLPHFDNPEHNLPSHLTASHPELAQHVTHHDLWKMLFDNNMADEVIRITSLYSSPSSVCGPQYLINMIAVHVEPLLQNDEQLLTMLRRIRTELRDRQMLLSNQVAENWSSRATRLVAQSFLIPAGLHRELQYRVCIPWSWLDSEHHVDPILTKFDSIAFEVRVRYEERASNIVMTCRQLDETATEDRKRVSVSLVVMDTGCRCKCEERLDREWSGLIAEENHPTNSQDVADVMGEVSIIDAQDLQQWWERHEEGCEIDVNIKLEVD